MDNRKVRAYFCLLPVFGAIPSIVSLLRDQDGKVKDAAKVSLVLFAIWVTSYLSLGGSAPPETFSQIPATLLKGTIGSAYFVASLLLMYRIYRNQPVQLPPFQDD